MYYRLVEFRGGWVVEMSRHKEQWVPVQGFYSYQPARNAIHEVGNALEPPKVIMGPWEEVK